LLVCGETGPLAQAALDRLARRFEDLGFPGAWHADGRACDHAQGLQRHRLAPALRQRWAPGDDTERLADALALDASDDEALVDEIIVSLMACPVTIAFPSGAEFDSHLRMRTNIVRAAQRTALDFDGRHAERPGAYWLAQDGDGFVIRPDVRLAEALRMATQPAVSGRTYAFGCYRATEYVILLGIVEELASCNPALLAEVERQWRDRAIQSAAFHRRLLLEYGSREAPLPARYYVPGDRIWFRNPDERSSDVEGYEGSWVIYLGHGRFSNFWKRGASDSLEDKCLEIYHWRDGLVRGEDGAMRVDESRVEACVAATRRDPAERARVLAAMMRLADVRGVYAEGGCIDRTREYPRHVQRASTTLVMDG
jgi:hypothetical protein